MKKFFLLRGKIYHKLSIIEVACPFMFEIRVVSLWTISSNEWRINHVLCQKVAYMDRCFDNHKKTRYQMGSKYCFSRELFQIKQNGFSTLRTTSPRLIFSWMSGTNQKHREGENTLVVLGLCSDVNDHKTR
jgi:hypothetical protein